MRPTSLLVVHVEEDRRRDNSDKPSWRERFLDTCPRHVVIYILISWLRALCSRPHLTSMQENNSSPSPKNVNLVPSGATSAVFQPSQPLPENAVPVQGPNFDEPITLQNLLGSYERIGFQATSLGRAIEIVNKMVSPVHL